MAFTLATQATTLPVEVVAEAVVATEGAGPGYDFGTPGPLLPDGTHYGAAVRQCVIA